MEAEQTKKSSEELMADNKKLKRIIVKLKKRVKELEEFIKGGAR